MAAARTAVRGLSTTDVETIRDTLAAGRKTRVMFTAAAGQIAGQLGHVVGLTDPSRSDEWVVVRFGRDELPFSPTDLAIAPRASARRPEPTPVRRAAPLPAQPTAGGNPTTAPMPAPREEATVTSSTVDAPASAAPAEPRPARRAARPARPKGPTGLTVTLAYGGGEWTVGAQLGSRALAKPYAIKPAEALKMVALLDVPGVHEAVEHIVAVERAEAERAAERLRAELAEIEARLAELRGV
ncbi:MAG TPA: hypothetical protein VGJ63_13605 [Micromonosporaceae bacterium]|jgi:hypothetical protein